MPVQILPYLRGLLQGTNITATFLARQFGCSHDGVTRFLVRQFSWKETLMRCIHHWFGLLHQGYLIIDDTVIAKPYGKKFAQASFAYSSNLNGVVYGYHVVVLCWTNGFVTVPLSWRFYRKGGKSKVVLAQDLLKEAKTRWKITPRAVLFDSWYAAADLLDQIHCYHWTFVCQIKSNRVVNGASIKDDLITNGESLNGPLSTFVSLVLRHDDKFFATNMLLVSNQRLIATYRLRWNIENVFRFLKSELHLEECQARSKTAQETHLASCLLAYLLVQKERQLFPDKTLYQIKTDWLLDKRLGNNRINHYVVKVLFTI